MSRADSLAPSVSPPRDTEAWRRLAAQEAAAIAVARARTLDEGAAQLLAGVGERLGFASGSLWLGSESLTLRTTWRVERVPEARKALALEAARTRALCTSERGLAFPVLVERQVVGVIEFSGMPRAAATLAPVFDVVALQAGAFISRITALQELREASALRGAILDAAPDSVVTMSVEGRITEFNAAAERAFGYAREDAVGRSLLDTIVPPESRDEFLAHLEGSADHAKRFQLKAARRDGSVFPAEVTLVRLPVSGRPTFTLFVRDVTERLRADADLEDSRRQLLMNEKLSALGTLISGVAHELRTPLTYVANNIFLVQVRLEAAARERADLETLLGEVTRFSNAALEGVDRINALVKDLRPFTHAEGARRALASLHVVVGDAVELFRATQRGRIEVDAQLEPTPPVLIDRGELQRVVINLLTNAAEAMSQRGGVVRVRTRASPAGALLVVEDEGGGILPEARDRLFDPFFTTKKEGTGLGLAITRRIVEGHGGSIRFDSVPGRGTTFTIELPA